MTDYERIKREFNLSLVQENKRSIENNAAKLGLLLAVITNLQQSIQTMEQNIGSLETNILDKAFPVGSIYISLKDTNPAQLFGGEWELIPDRFLIGAGEKYAALAQGGSEQHQHSLEGAYAHLATSTTNIRFRYLSTENWSAQWSIKGAEAGTESSSTMKEGITLGGNTASADSLPPYIAVYMWKRIS